MSFWDELENEEEDSWEDDEWDESLDIAMEEPEEDFGFNSEDEEDIEESYYIPTLSYQGEKSFTNINTPKSGSIAVSHNNPGNIKYGDFSKRYGATPGRNATDGGVFANFPDVATGLKAKQDLLLGKSYRNLSVDQAMKRWSNNGYDGNIYPEIRNKKIAELSTEELSELSNRQIKREDGKMAKQLGIKQFGGDSYTSSVSDYIKQYGGNSSYRPDYNPLAPGQEELLGENLQLQNLFPASAPNNDENNQLYDFGFVEKFPDIYNNVSKWMKNTGSRLAQGASGMLDTTNDYLSDIETTKKYRKMSEYMNQSRYFPINQTVNNVPIFT
jgi:hypothetical protein